MDFDKIIDEAEVNLPESETFSVQDFGKTERWLKKRCGKITSSTLPNLMKQGRGGIKWGEGSKDVLYPVKYERRTGLTREAKDYIKNFQFGKEHEPSAIAWLKNNGYPDIIHSEDQEEIIFNEPFAGFGDSPDFIGDKIVGEIKCHVDQGKIEKYRELKEIHEGHENYWQLLGHFIGMPEAETLLFVSYDAYADDAHVVGMPRKAHENNIEKLTKRIKDASYVVNQALSGGTTIGEINEFLETSIKDQYTPPEPEPEKVEVYGVGSNPVCKAVLPPKPKPEPKDFDLF